MISVIVPVYKVERYLSRCIDSILAQKQTNFELLLINDGSPDGSGAICDEYAAKDPRIKVFHKDNGGVSSARNVGLDNASGDWVCFVDSDDWVSEGYLHIPPKFQDADIIQKSYVTRDMNNKPIRSNVIDREIELTSTTEIDDFYVNHRNNALWDKIIARRVVGNRRFNTNVYIGEDFLFLLSCFEGVNRYAFSRVGSYNYLVREDSVMQCVDSVERVEILFKNIDNIESISKSRRMRCVQKSIIYSSYISRLVSARKQLTSAQREILCNLVIDFDWSDLIYLSFKNRVKLYVCKLILGVGL